ncbi:TonB-dependent receptor domain-containing protein [Caulobacter hibisci]|uniref:TonB-dependent receptor n=1 Tax=Caulobacter hibisci TaxID=2035993 RepID=A0ABS0T242_9CAUL|nr:TonB-dependent receptor [Caulobacter hibisci]
MCIPTLRRRLLAGLAVSTFVIPATFAVVPAPAAAEQSLVTFDIPPGPLDRALTAFGEQSGQQLLYSPEEVAGLKSKGLRGRLTPECAIERLLEGAPMQVRRGNLKSFVLKRQVTPIAFDGAAAVSRPADLAPAAPVEVEEIVVTGTLIRGANDGPSPVVTLDADALNRSGRATLVDALAALPQNFGGGSTPANQLLGADRSFTNDTVSTGINLRGLGSSATLVLINGRRIAGTGLKGNFADVSAIPTSAVDRVEVLLDGASALYGSDAVGGVVNVLLKRDFEGAETRARVSVAEGGTAQERQLSQTLGKRWSGGSAVLSAEYYRREALAADERTATATADLRALGGTDRRTIYAHPGNIVVYSASAGGYVPLYAIPRTGATKASDFTAGTANYGDSRKGSDTLPAQERASVYASLRQDIGKLELSAEGLYTRRRFTYRQAGASTIFTVRAANPYFVSPTGATSHLIAYDFSDDLGPKRTTGNSENLALTLAAGQDFGRTWRWDVYGAYGVDQGERNQNKTLNSRFLSEALGNIADDAATSYSAARDGYFNPFGANNRTVLDFINSGYQHHSRRNRVTSGGLQLDGTLARLPAGDVKLAFGAQGRHEDFIVWNTNLTSAATPTTTDGKLFERDVASAYAELRVPLVSPDMAVPAVRRLELSLAGRVERYSDFGSTENPKIGAIWEPAAGLKVRASYGTSFRAPTLADIHEKYAVGATFLTNSKGQQVLILMKTGGNEDLGPETAKTWTVGADFTPSFAPRGARLSVTYFDTRFSNQVGHPVYDDIVNALTNPIYAGFVRTLDPTNAADMAAAQELIDDPTSTDAKLFPATAFGAIIDGRNLNAGELDVRGLDLQATWPVTLLGQNLTFIGDASYLIDYQRKLTKDAAAIQYVDQAGFPVDWRANLGVSWSRGSLMASGFLRYVDDYATSAGRRIGSWTTLDLQVQWTAPAKSGPLSGLVVAAGAQNLLGQDPPFYDAVQGVGYDPANADVLGRVLSLQLTKRW